MSEIPSELRYTKSHEWARNEDGNIVVGITAHAQALLGDIVFIELPELDTPIVAEEEAGVIESVKAASDLYSPVTGTVVAVNDALKDAPDMVNQDPYATGWIFKVKPDDENEINELLDPEEYQDLVEAEDH